MCLVFFELTGSGNLPF